MVRALAWLAVLVLIPAAAIAQPTRPGMMVSAEPMAGVPAGNRAWRIRYTTTSDSGAPIEVTGAVIVPDGPPPAGGRPVLAWTHGAWGVVDKCTPSASPNFFAATAAVPGATSRGYIVVAPDYPGLGSAVPHPFLVGKSTGQAVLDAVRAVQGWRQGGAAPGGKFAVWGESQGGHAALWTAQLARSYAPDLTLVGAAAAAPPSDLVQNLTAGTDPSVRAFLTAFAAYSWSQHYRAPLSTLGNKATAGVITRLAQNNCVTLGKSPKLGMMLGILVLRRDLKNVDLGRIQPWARLARQNSPSAKLSVPMLIAQNTKDAIVGSNVTHAYARKLCANNVRVRYIPMTTPGGHATSAKDSETATLDWIDDRFAGRRAPNDCGKF